jgi:tyrosyl-tRNA synthetase
MKSAKEQYDYITRTLDVTLPEGELLARLGEERPLRVKLGVDPTAPDVTLGWAVVFDLLRRFQEMGHVAVLIIGDFTAQVGDPSERKETRKRLDAGEVDAYASNCLPIIRELLSAENLEIRPNSDWLATMDMRAVLELTSKVTVARVMDRDDFTKRWAAREPISLIEFMYPLLQAMDSVAVGADVELGGADQLWNLLIGREIQERYGQRPQTVVTVPLLVGTDGQRKMSQSYGNYISVTDPADQMFGKAMSIPDDVMPEWYLLAAGVDTAEVDTLRGALTEGSVHPGTAKRELGRRIVARYHGPDAAGAAEEAFDRLFVVREAPDEVREYPLAAGDPVWLPAVLASADLVSSNSEGRRMIAQGAVRVDGERVSDEQIARAEVAGKVVQVGKRRFARLV